MGALSTHAVNPSLYSKMPYDAQRDFAPITRVAITPNVLVVNPSLPVNSVKELIAYAKAHPGQLSFGSGSTGSAGHLAGELFKVDAGIDMVHVPYKGAAPAMQALLAGDTQLMFDNLANAMAQVKAGKLRALAVTTAERSKLAPELPTMAEAGVAGFDISTWFGLFAPAGTPPEIIGKWNADVVLILDSPEMRDRLIAQGAEAAPDSPAERRNPDARSDIHALGMTLYRLVSGLDPQEFDDLAQIRKFAPSAFNRAIPPALDALIQSSIAGDPIKRPQNAEEFARKLDELERPPTPAKPVGPISSRTAKAPVPQPAATAPEPTLKFYANEEPRTVEVKDGSFADWFGPNEVHVYKFSRK
jgi:hypothetical protein